MQSWNVQYAITITKYKYFPESVAFQMLSGSWMQQSGTHNTWQCSRTGQSNACLVLCVYVCKGYFWAKTFQEAREPNRNSTILTISLWSLRLHEPVKRQIAGHSQDNILGRDDNLIQNSLSGCQMFLEVKQCIQSRCAVVMCKTCNQAATSSPKYYIVWAVFCESMGKYIAPVIQGFH